MNGLHEVALGSHLDRDTAGTRRLIVPEEVLIATFRALAPTASRGWEGTTRWAAPATLRGQAIQVVTTVIVPQQVTGPGRYEIPHAATRAMGECLVEHELVNVAQVHSHPDWHVQHSPWDDDHAYSRRDGALSIVWPCYGTLLPAIEHWGVHECQNRAWRLLGPGEVAHRIVITPSTLDLRLSLGTFSAFCGGLTGSDRPRIELGGREDHGPA